MPHSLDQLLPSLQSLGLWTYWILALFAMLEAIIFTGLLVPGAVAVIAGGMLVQRGTIDFFDLAWFIAAGTILGSEISFRLGQLATRGLSRTRSFAASHHALRAKDLLQRYGGFAMVVGRFLGPLSAFVPFSAAMAGMSRRRFTVWNLTSAIPYALILPAIGYFFGSALGTMGAAAPRILAFAAAVLIALGVIWFVFARMRRALPMLAEVLHAIMTALLKKPFMQRQVIRHPKISAFVAARFETARFLGLTATVLGLLFIYIFGVYLDSVFDFLGSPDVASADTRIANLLYALRDDRLTALFGWITALGGWEIVVTMLTGATAALVLSRRYDLAAGLWLSAVGSQLCVMLLKSFFDRPRSALGYFTETSGSFPSGHAASSVAILGMLFYVAWRTRILSATTAGLAAITVAFLIGLSRVYLVEHYLSDVLNGYLIGSLWLIIGITFCEWRRETASPQSAPERRPLALGIISTTLIIALSFASVISTPLNKILATPVTIVSDPMAIFASASVSTETETLIGDPRQLVNLVVAAPDAETLGVAMQGAGWTLAQKPGLGLLSRAFWADWTGAALPRPLVISTFWNDRPSDLRFALPDAGTSDDLRLHARFWQTAYQVGGMMILVGTLTLEDPIDWAVDADTAAPPTRPVGAQLDLLLTGLRASGLIALPVQ